MYSVLGNCRDNWIHKSIRFLFSHEFFMTATELCAADRGILGNLTVCAQLAFN